MNYAQIVEIINMPAVLVILFMAVFGMVYGALVLFRHR